MRWVAGNAIMYASRNPSTIPREIETTASRGSVLQGVFVIDSRVRNNIYRFDRASSPRFRRAFSVYVKLEPVS